MYKYTLTFVGRLNGVIGCNHECAIEFASPTEMSSIQLLHYAYNTHEHISNFSYKVGI